MLIFISIIIIIIGFLFKLCPPRSINGLYGYRTKTSMQDQTSWNLAQKLGALSFLILGLFLNIMGLLLLIFNFNNEILELLLFIISMISMVIIDEIMLKKCLKKKR